MLSLVLIRDHESSLIQMLLKGSFFDPLQLNFMLATFITFTIIFPQNQSYAYNG